MKQGVDWERLERQAVNDLPALKAKLETPMSDRQRLGLLLRVAVLSDFLKSRETGG